ncbi:3-deoxy-D-manno-octulosonic acid transferase [Afipia sp. Root123D2]|uniref:3-deoxy-D-manno-octulosonic acid transferase n=1 Tax=Afipia sp. Root123D2 TaxID=1736436 RepID=UPI0006F8849E|nr:3-deoxy-D-manno-octulosonic acid transferase [Afipia sp. Root123D2]KQW21538.1 3-deoxy-D-manno-octulosonic acid transferase [Afipia sp. Root123D2]
MPSALPITLRLYRRASSLATPLLGTIVKRRLKQGKEDRLRLGERRGIGSAPRPQGPLIWIHGASVGEVLAAAGLIERLRKLDVRVLLTSGTVTSAEVAARRFPPDVIHQYVPFDAPRFVTPFLEHWKPDLALFIESDLWPNLVLSTAERRIPMVLINGRMSQRSYPRWRRAYGTISTLLSCFDLCLAQSDTDGERFSTLGCPNVVTSGNLKLDVPAPPADPRKLERLKAATQRRTVFVAASTHPGEEEIVLDAHRRLGAGIPSLLSVIVPRHPARGVAIARMLAAGGMQVSLRSAGEVPSANTDIYVADTMGEMGLFYRIAPVVFMGGSLIEHGGQNPIEAIKLGAAIVHGPQVFNFTEIYQALDSAGGAFRAEDSEQFVKLLGHLLVNPIARQNALNAAEDVVARLGGALDKTLSALEPYLLQMRLERGADA